MLQSTDLGRITLLGAPDIHPGQREKLVLAKGKMDIERDAYSSQLILFNTATRTEAPLFAAPPDGQGPAADASPRWSPDGELLAFMRTGGLWLYEPSTGAARPHVTERKVKDYIWAPDGRSIVFTSRDNEVNATAYKIKRMRYKLDGEGMTNGYTHLFEVNVGTSEISRLTSGESDYGNPAFSPDGSALYFTTDFPDGFDLEKRPEIRKLDRASGSISKLKHEARSVSALIPLPDGSVLGTGKKDTPNSAEFDKWFYIQQGGEGRWLEGNVDVPLGYHVIGDSKRTGLNAVVRAANEECILFAGTNEGRQTLYKLDTASLEITALPLELNVLAFDVEYATAREIAVVLVADAMDRPGELYRAVWREKSDKVAVERLTNCNEELRQQLPALDIREHSHLTPDGLTVQGWTMDPVTESGDVRQGTILMIHGGPHLAYGHSFHYDFWHLASRGYRIAFCNPRGSYGYGQAFSYGIIKEWGGKDVQDILGFLENAVASGDAAADEPLYLMGGSYGGYLVNWIIGRDHRFKAAVTERSICNMYSKIGNSDLGFQINLYELGGQSDLWNDEEFIMERSPIRYAREVATPLLIIHAEKDHRVPVEQAEQWFQALKRLGKEVEFMLFPGASHALASIGRPQQRVARLEALADWFAVH